MRIHSWSTGTGDSAGVILVVGKAIYRNGSKCLVYFEMTNMMSCIKSQIYWAIGFVL
jgi:hypothetical protein